MSDFRGWPRDFADWQARRAAERDWAFANGLNLGDPARNGEFATLDLMLPHLDALVDVGANEGLFSGRAARTRPDLQILAVEPNPAMHASIRAQAPAAALTGCAVADIPDDTRARLHVRDDQPGTASLTERSWMNPSYRAGMHTIEVPLRRLDAVIQDAGLADAGAMLVKIDVEGHEAGVMRSGAATLARGRARAVMFEFSYGWRETGEDLRAAMYALDTAGLALWRITPFALEHVRFFTPDMAGHQYANYLALRGFGLEALGPRRTLATPYGETVAIPFPERR